MKYSRKATPLKVISAPYFVIPYLQPFKNGGRSNLHQSVLENKILYADKYSKDEQPLTRQFFF
jgi:hypothetical protein